VSTNVVKRMTLLCACLAAGALLWAASTARADGPAQYCYSVFLYAGGTQDSSNTCVHGVSHRLNTVQAKSEGTAASCAGGFNQPSVNYGNWSATYGGPTCGGDGGNWVYHDSYGDQEYPALHNHSTFQSRFDGLFYYVSGT
jgi:hypothetical protein